MKARIAAVLAALTLPLSLHAQITFERTYGGTGYDNGSSVLQTDNGGYLIAGSTNSFGAGGDDMYLIKTDAHGETAWTRTYGGTGDDGARSVQRAVDGGFVTAGSTKSFGAGHTDFYLVKIDTGGDTTWTKAVGDTNFDYFCSAKQTFDSGYVLVGSTTVYNRVYVYLIKTDARGDTQWIRSYGSGAFNQGSSVLQTSDSDYVIVGYDYFPGGGSQGAILLRVNADGDYEWGVHYGGGGDDQCMDVDLTADGGCIIAGWTKSFGAGKSDVFLIKAGADGGPLWSKTFGGDSSDAGYSVQQTLDGGYIIAGYTASSGAGSNDVYLVRTDANGDMLWARTYGGASNDYAASVQQAADGGFIIVGTTYSFGAGNSDVYLIKTDSLGLAVGETHASPARPQALPLFCEPNPFRTKTAISLQPNADSQARLAVFDASGRCVRRFTVNRTPCVVWNGTDELGRPLPSGAYFVRVGAGNGHATTRVVLQR